MSELDDKIHKLLSISIKKIENFKPNQDIPKDPNPLKLSKWYANEISVFTNQIQLIEKECDITCSCSIGCSACCKQLIVLFRAEQLALIPTIESLDTKTILTLKNTVIEQCKIMLENNITNKEANSKSRTVMDKIQDNYFKLNLKCPLLNDNNECMVYNVRPILCWSYKNYGEKILCEETNHSPYCVKFNEWEHLASGRILAAKKPRQNEFRLLQFALREILQI